jgi:deoxyribodipyrimidine photo-lyase
MNALLEEMVVRKELSDNYCLHNEHYTSIKGGPEWGQKTLDEHRDDPRDFEYSREEWEDAKTHDDSWNAAQKQLMKTGKMHGYMRMYWAKKMLEWSKTPEQALEDCIYLNDKYSIDGGDPNGYVGMLWSMTGLHDRPWTQRSVFGQVRYMNEGGLKRKFNIKKYQEDWL